MSFEVDNLPEDLYAYVHVFEINDDIVKDNKKNTTQYRCYKEIKPIDIVKVNYKDFESYFDRNKCK